LSIELVEKLRPLVPRKRCTLTVTHAPAPQASVTGMVRESCAFRTSGMKRRRQVIGTVALALVGLVLGALLATRHISAVAAPFVKAAARDLPEVRVGLVLGCSAKMTDGRENLFFARRISAASELFRAGRVQYLLLSGDNSRADYDEPGEMRRALVRAGVPASRLVLDHAGFRTLDSVMRAKDVFGLEEVIVVSQHFHNERAVYLARAHGLKAFGFDAQGVGGLEGARIALREAVSRTFAVLDVNVFHTKPHFDGPRETLPPSL
jgi:SanA protein